MSTRQFIFVATIGSLFLAGSVSSTETGEDTSNTTLSTAATGLARPGEINRVNVGGTWILLPAPEGFFRYDGRSPKIDQYQNALASAGNNRLVATFGSESVLTDVLKNAFPSLDRYFAVQTVRDVEKDKMTESMFAEFKRMLRSQADALVRESSRQAAQMKDITSGALSKAVQTPAYLKLREMTSQGAFDETLDSICLCVIAKLQAGVVETGAEPVEKFAIIADCSVCVRQRLIELTYYSIYNSPKDIEWAQTHLKMWRDAVIAANATDSGSSSPPLSTTEHPNNPR